MALSPKRPCAICLRQIPGLSLLPQGERPSWNIESCCSISHADLTRVRRICADRTVTLASSAPEHVAQHSGGCSCARWGDCRDEVVRGLLVRTAERTDAVRARVVTNHP